MQFPATSHTCRLFVNAFVVCCPAGTAVVREKVERHRRVRQHSGLRVDLRQVDRVAADPVGLVVADSISTKCSRGCQLFRLPMLRSATPSSFPVRREWIPLA